MPGVSLDNPVEANEVFCRLPQGSFDAIVAAGIGTYPLSDNGDGTGSIRFVCSFNTDPGDVDRLIAAAKAG